MPINENDESKNRQDDATRTNRFIELPADIYALRERFPSALKFLLLECQRCAQWVPVEVTSTVPHVLPCALRPEDHSRFFSAEWSHFQPLQFSSTTIPTNAVEGEKPTSAKWELNDETKTKDGVPEQCHAWHSPRLRAHEQEATITDGVSSSSSNTEKADEVHDSPKRNQLFIPNPACFVCSGLMCEKGDRLLDLRLDWLKALYASCIRDEELPAGQQDAVNLEDEDIRSNLKARVASKLSDELDIRRSRRLASQRKQSSSAEISLSDDYPTPTSPLNLSSVDWIQKLSKKVLEDDAVLSSCFCWVVCDLCGKVRRTAQPFPGGAPFVCALSVAGSCKVSEAEGLVRYNQTYTSRTIQRISLHAQTPPIPLVLSSPLVSKVSKSRKAEVDASSLLLAYQNEPVLRQLSYYAGLTEGSSSQSGKSTTGICCDPKKLFPSLKLLTSTIRKRSIANTVKRVVINPEEIRKKREEAIRAMFTEDETIKESEHETSSTYEKKKEIGKEDKVVVKKEENDDEHDQVTRNARGLMQRQTNSTKTTLDLSSVRGRACVAEESGEVKRTLKHVGVPEDEEETYGRTAFVSMRQNPRKAQEVASTPTESVEALKKEPRPPTDVSMPAPPLPRQGGEKEGHSVTPPAVVDKTASSSGDAPAIKRARGRPPKQVGSIAAATMSPPTKKRRTAEKMVIHWIQCDLCDKWRIIPHPIQAETWSCVMRPGTTCDDPEDVE